LKPSIRRKEVTFLLVDLCTKEKQCSELVFNQILLSDPCSIRLKLDFKFFSR
jgi:hypothetical protein